LNRSATDIFAFLSALPLVLAASRVISGEPVYTVLQRLTSRRLLPKRLTVEQARCGADRACRFVKRYRPLDDSCLVRALVLGTLLSDRRGVELHIGFRPPMDGQKFAAGHAWVSVNGINVSEPGGILGTGDYVPAKRIPISKKP
jgi:hypothetical protein